MTNYGDKGWIKLWRSEMHNPLYNAEPFTKWQAWMDLCMRADDEGTVRTSLKALKIRYSWTSIKKVRAFLGTVQGTGLGTVISIPNKCTLIRINKGNSAFHKRTKNGVKGTVEGTVSEIEEVTSFKEVGRASLEVSPPTSENNKEIMREEPDDEYGYE